MRILKWIGVAVVLTLAATAAWLWTPAGPRFDAAAARSSARAYDARIVRDRWGVPHIYGRRNADVSFGLAYAHAEDDWATIEETVRQARATYGVLKGKDGAVSDYLMRALGNIDAADRGYATIAAPARAIAEGYAAGINLWCADHPESDCARTAPVSGVDVVKGFAVRSPFFYGLDEELKGILDPPKSAPTQHAWYRVRGAPTHIELGSNAIAVAPSRAADGHTRLAVNSHQPYTGPVAWYAARLKSEEGIDIYGGVFPGAPLILHGAGPALGWASTVNHPDLSDVFRLVVDDEKHPTRYRMDGAWKPLTRFPIQFRVKLWGPFSLPVTRDGYRSEHGPVFVTPRGVFALSYVGDGEIRHLEQYLAMNTAKTVDEWRAAQLRIGALPSINFVVADSGGHIGYFWNAAMPRRAEGFDRKAVLRGDVSATLWQGREDMAHLPFVLNPRSGYVVNSNHSPLLASAPGDNPKAESFPASFGLDTLVTNRGLRAQTLYGGDASITREEFIAYKMDHRYDERSNVRAVVRDVLAACGLPLPARGGGGGRGEAPSSKASSTTIEASGVTPPPAPSPHGEGECPRDALSLLATWDGAADQHNRAAALAILTGQIARGGEIHGEATPAQELAALRQVIGKLKTAYGRIDPEWGEVSRLHRGAQTWPLDGGPDTLRAVYADGDLTKEHFLSGVAGDTLIIIADWAPDGALRLDAIHQFGSATLDVSSPHYADQAPLFAREEFTQPPMTPAALDAEKTSDKRIGGAR